MKRILLSLLAVCITVSAPTGCSQTSRTETRVSYDETGATESRTTVTETEKHSDDGCGGILSCTVDTLGTIIAFPFKVVGSLITAIF